MNEQRLKNSELLYDEIKESDYLISVVLAQKNAIDTCDAMMERAEYFKSLPESFNWINVYWGWIIRKAKEHYHNTMKKS